jgi:DNA-directed RNA polymerase specialized sigma24 family protein
MPVLAVRLLFSRSIPGPESCTVSSLGSACTAAALIRDARRLQDCLDELEEGRRKILRLVYYEGMTYKEAAIHVGVPLGTAKTWVRHSLVRLKVCMQR